jgi:hypothetical protein
MQRTCWYAEAEVVEDLHLGPVWVRKHLQQQQQQQQLAFQGVLCSASGPAECHARQQRPATQLTA